MIIVSQNKEQIINLDNIVLISVNIQKPTDILAWNKLDENEQMFVRLGKYSTEERAKEVLREMVNVYSSYMKLEGGPAILRGTSDVAPAIFNIPKVYEMPEE